MLGRLASIVAKQLLNGQHVVSSLPMFCRASCHVALHFVPMKRSLPAFPYRHLSGWPPDHHFCINVGHRPCGRDHSLRRPSAAKDEVRALPEEKDEFQSKEGAYPLPCSIQDLLEDSEGGECRPAHFENQSLVSRLQPRVQTSTCYGVQSEAHALLLIMLVQDGAAQDAARSSSPGEAEDL